MNTKETKNNETNKNITHSNKAIYDGHSLNDIDKQAMEDIEKKIRKSSFKKEKTESTSKKVETESPVNLKIKRTMKKGSETSVKPTASSCFLFKNNNNLLKKKYSFNQNILILCYICSMSFSIYCGTTSFGILPPRDGTWRNVAPLGDK